MTQRHSVFFDLDGTLTDPWLGISRCIEHALDALDVEPDPGDDYRWCIGPPLRESFAVLAGRDRAERALSIYRERYSRIGWKENTPYDGVHTALETLRENGHTLFVATSKPLAYAKQILQHFDLAPYLEDVFGAELDGTRSNKSELLEYALAARSETHANSDSDAVMIGDRRYDMVGARSNGMVAIGVSYGYGSVEELLDAGAGRIVNSPTEIVSAVQD